MDNLRIKDRHIPSIPVEAFRGHQPGDRARGERRSPVRMARDYSVEEEDGR